MRVRRVALALLGAAALGGCAGGSEPSPAAPRAVTAPARTVTAPSLTTAPAPAAAPEAVPAPVGDLGARLRTAAVLRARPAGRPVARLGTRTEFGSPRVLAVVRRRPGWLGVLAVQRGNGRVGWIRAGRARLVSEPARVEVDLSQRRLRVVRGHRTVFRMPVGVGAPATPTPTGRFAVTDGILFSGASAYGCCALAFTARQPHVAQDWPGGDRIAVHGTTDPASIGAAESHGCLRAHDADVRRLVHLVPPGALVRIRR